MVLGRRGLNFPADENFSCKIVPGNCAAGRRVKHSLCYRLDRSAGITSIGEPGLCHRDEMWFFSAAVTPRGVKGTSTIWTILVPDRLVIHHPLVASSYRGRSRG